MQIYTIFVAADNRPCSSIFIPNNVTVPTLFPSHTLSPICSLIHYKDQSCTLAVSRSKPKSQQQHLEASGGFFHVETLTFPAYSAQWKRHRMMPFLSCLPFVIPPFPSFVWHLKKHSGIQINFVFMHWCSHTTSQDPLRCCKAPLSQAWEPHFPHPILVYSSWAMCRSPSAPCPQAQELECGCRLLQTVMLSYTCQGFLHVVLPSWWAEGRAA